MGLSILKPRVLSVFLNCILASYFLPAQAENLIEVYLQAVANDASFRQAEADWMAAREQLPIAYSALLPNISADAGIAYNNQNFTTDAAFAENGQYWSSSLALNLYQPIFNWAAWKNVQSAAATVKAATANYCFAQQDLITRTIKAYLNVLQANDILRFTRANKAAFAEEYDTAKQKFDVGLVPITDVYDAQAKYDQSASQELANINSLEDALENLRQITNHYYVVLYGLGEKGIPLIFPHPNNISDWALSAAQKNYQLQAQHFVAMAAKANIGVQAAGHLPELSIQGTANDQRQYQRELTFVTSPKKEELVQQLSTIGLVASIPIYSGGSVVAKTRQARYNYASECAQEEVVFRKVVAQTRQAFLGVVSDSAQVKADAQSIISAKNALASAKAGYEVGTRTLLDVLDDTTQLYQSQEEHALDQYSYMNNFVALKEASGTLGGDDVKTLSKWLTKPINLDKARQLSTNTNPKQPRQVSTINDVKSSTETTDQPVPETKVKPEDYVK